MRDKVFQIALCDDLSSDLKSIAALTEKLLREHGIDYDLSLYHSGADLMAAIRNGMRYDLLLLDVLMEELDGIELARLLRLRRDETTIVFLSINRELALKGYEVSATRYLAKPIKEAALREALLHCYHQWREKAEILVPTEQGQHRISLSGIQFIEAYDRGTRFVLMDEIIETRLKFKDLEPLLPKGGFFSCHRAFLVNAAHIKRIRPFEFDLRSGQRVPISKHRYPEIREKFFDYFVD